ncbi:MAG TPA: hypothetical protein VEO56_07855 [Bacteroidota bacterium]|nr:hypothetical protein [Bacteroidota bacterium]
MKGKQVDGIEIPYSLDQIRGIDPDLVGHATLFRQSGGPWEIVRHLDGRIRDLLLSDYYERTAEKFPEIIMYSGTHP